MRALWPKTGKKPKGEWQWPFDTSEPKAEDGTFNGARHHRDKRCSSFQHQGEPARCGRQWRHRADQCHYGDVGIGVA
jgi:hypothetical protein